MENKVEENTQAEQQKEKKNFKKLGELKTILDNMKCNNIHIMEIPEEENEQGIENLSEEIMTENFPSLVKEKDKKSRKLRQSQTIWTQRGLHQDTQ